MVEEWSYLLKGFWTPTECAIIEGGLEKKWRFSRVWNVCVGFDSELYRAWLQCVFLMIRRGQMLNLAHTRRTGFFTILEASSNVGEVLMISSLSVEIPYGAGKQVRRTPRVGEQGRWTLRACE